MEMKCTLLIMAAEYVYVQHMTHYMLTAHYVIVLRTKCYALHCTYRHACMHTCMYLKQ